MAAIRIGELLISKGLLSEEQLKIALLQQPITKKLIGDIIIDLGFVSSVDMAKALAEQAGLEFIDVRRYPISEEALHMVPREIAESMGCLPIRLSDGVLSIGVRNPGDVRAIDTAAHLSGRQPKVYVIDTASFYDVLDKAYFFLKNPIHSKIESILSDLKGASSVHGASIASLTELLIMDSIRRNATDMHITPDNLTVQVFNRIDGVMQHMYCLPKNVHAGMVSRLKILGNLDIAEQRLPQDGSFSFKISSVSYDIRISVVPTIHGENVVLRILSGSCSLASLSGLGFDANDTARLKQLFKKPHGLILIAGPTGSGKTTTLYSALREINLIERNVLTVEDPVEYRLSMVKQTQVASKVGYDFAMAGKSFMRQDPDVMLIGEIRDTETASISVRASITGHLVLSTIHTNDAITVIPRLLDMDVDRFMLSSALLAVVAQRLARKICPNCRREHEYSAQELAEAGLTQRDLDGHALFKGAGCEFCNNTGYLGRTVIGEVLVVSERLKEYIYSGASVKVMKDAAAESGMVTMRENGIRKVLAGVTTIEEVMRVVG